MQPLILEDQSPPAGRQTPAALTLVTVVVGAMALWLTWPQVHSGPVSIGHATLPTLPTLTLTLPDLNRRVATLRQILDPVERDKLCTPFSARGRVLDRSLPPDAHVFLSGIVGKDNGSKLSAYFFLRNYLFPRNVEISLDGRAVFHEWWFEGVSSDSPEELRSNGFDVWLRIPARGNAVEVRDLSTKGAPQ